MGVKGSRWWKFLGLSLFFHLLFLLPVLLPLFFEEVEPLDPTVEAPILVQVLDQPMSETGPLPVPLGDVPPSDRLARRPSDVEGPTQSPESVGVPHREGGQGPGARGQNDWGFLALDHRPFQDRARFAPSGPSEEPIEQRVEPLDLGKEGEGGPAREQTVSLASRSLPYSPYLASVKRKIEGLWGYPAEAKARGVTGELLVGFTILSDGRLKRLDLLKTSGFSILDEAALGAIRKAAPYAPFPKRMDLDRLHITASFLYYHSLSPQRGGS